MLAKVFLQVGEGVFGVACVVSESVSTYALKILILSRVRRSRKGRMPAHTKLKMEGLRINGRHRCHRQASVCVWLSQTRKIPYCAIDRAHVTCMHLNCFFNLYLLMTKAHPRRSGYIAWSMEENV